MKARTVSVILVALPLLVSLASGQTATINQEVNGNDLLYGKRATDASASGNLVHFQNHAGTTDLWTVDVGGNGTFSSIAVGSTGTPFELDMYDGAGTPTALKAPGMWPSGGTSFAPYCASWTTSPLACTLGWYYLPQLNEAITTIDNSASPYAIKTTDSLIACDAGSGAT